jgi:hypothetical protein
MTLRAFHNDPSVKEKYLARVNAHMAADNLIRGVGWENGRGCAVGCTLEAYEHDRYETELGIPEWLARLEDQIFEGMSEEKSRTWPRDFLSAIPIGASLEKIKGPFLVIVLQSTLETFDHEKFPAVKAAIDGSIALWQRNDIGSDSWAAARDSAWAAAWAATGDAGDAAGAAGDAAGAAGAAAWAAGDAGAAKFDYFADELLKLLREAA